ncbi:MAG: recombinase RecA [Rickettsiales bacterium]|jgi:recombination protein RecA|nr:recombinase RecA [Rickettsiales bacterium]
MATKAQEKTQEKTTTSTLSAEKKKALDIALGQIDKQFGKGAAMRFGQRPIENIQVIPSGSLTLDAALGVGGYPRGRITEIFGQESSGKTTLTLHAITEAQKMGLTCAFVDAEHAFDPTYASALGINLEEMVISQPSSGEEALEITDTLVRSGAVDLIVVDSVAALVPKAELEGGMDENQMGLQARLMSKALRKITGSISKTNSAVIFINQVRMKIGISYGSPEVTTGGNALKFYTSVRIEVRKGQQIKNKDTAVGNLHSAKVVKNKVAPPFRVANFEMCYGEGVSKIGEIIDLGTSFEILEKSGSWYSYNSQRLGQGRENIKEYLKKNPELCRELELRIKEKLNTEPPQISLGGNSGDDDGGGANDNNEP